MTKPEKLVEDKTTSSEVVFGTKWHTNTVNALIAGGIVGCSELFLSYPFELAKTQLQLDKKGKPNQFLGIRDVLKRTIKANGVFGLYKGLAVVAFFKLPQESVRFGVYEEMKSRSPVDERGDVLPTMRFLCGFTAGVTEAVVAVTPMDSIKVKLIHDQRQEHPVYKSFFLKAVINIIKAEGITGVYQGLVPTIMKQASNHGIRFFLVDTFKSAYKGDDRHKRIPTPLIGLFGICAGTVSVLLTQPVDVVKTRLQGFHSKSYGGTINCFKRIYTEEGLSAFYKGTQARLFRVGIDAGYTFMCYDLLMSLLDALLPSE